MKTFLRYLGLSLPWLVALPRVVDICVRAYFDGSGFSQGMLFFKWLGEFYEAALVFIPAWLVAMSIALHGHLRRKPPRSTPWAVLVTLASLVVPCGGFVKVSSSFSSGRERAYKSLDYQAIHVACKDWVASMPPTTQWPVIVYREEQDKAPVRLPPAISGLSPIFVAATPHAVAIQMDGGGVMPHEGIGVVLADDPRESARVVDQSTRVLGGCRRVSAELPLVLYGLYDYRMFMGLVDEMLPATQPSPLPPTRTVP